MAEKTATNRSETATAETATTGEPAAAEKPAHHISLTLEETQLEIVEGDITELEIDAIVNAANEDLQLGSGVAGAIRERGGPSIQEECDRIGHTPVGTAVMTGAGNLRAKQVIHAVGPRMGEGDEDRKLSSAVRSALALADRYGLRSIALPAISTGTFGFPMDRAARITLTEVHRYLQGGTKIERVVIVLHGEDAFQTFRRELRRGFR
jgi:O-acetyl-ADP-ribose deacetylase